MSTSDGHAGCVQHYLGERGAERLVSKKYARGTAKHYEGERGAERLVRVERNDGNVQHIVEMILLYTKMSTKQSSLSSANTATCST